MPLARLSMRSALNVAQHAVSLHRQRGVASLWTVKTRYPAGTVSNSPAFPRLRAKNVRRERRIFVALCAIGIAESVAAQLATKGGAETMDWRKLVARYTEQYQLTN